MPLSKIPATYNKKFSGRVTVPLDSVNLIMKEDDLRFVPLLDKSFSKFEHVKSKEYDELTSRKKDVLAKMFVERYDKQRKEALR